VVRYSQERLYLQRFSAFDDHRRSKEHNVNLVEDLGYKLLGAFLLNLIVLAIASFDDL
jgi:hypothetical protein